EREHHRRVTDDRALVEADPVLELHGDEHHHRQDGARNEPEGQHDLSHDHTLWLRTAEPTRLPLPRASPELMILEATGKDHAKAWGGRRALLTYARAAIAWLLNPAKSAATSPP